MKLVLLALAVLVLAPAAAADTMAPVTVIRDAKLGRVLATPKRQAIYYWNREKDFRVHCTGACAKAWPPVVVRGAVPMHVQGLMGDLGTVRRPDGTRQLTLNRRPLYTYAHEQPGQVLCNDVDGWFAVKAR